ncbi:MAG: YraN family protein [Terriglobia bacterium]
MSWFARLIYHGLVWKERQRAARAERLKAADKPGGKPEHLKTGERGETLAYWFLRQAGYIIVARNRRARSGAGELDLVGWDGPVLAFVEVKTRTSDEAGPPEEAVTRSKQKRVARAAKEYLRRLRKQPAAFRFDIVSVFWDSQEGYKVKLIKDAFRSPVS